MRGPNGVTQSCAVDAKARGGGGEVGVKILTSILRQACSVGNGWRHNNGTLIISFGNLTFLVETTCKFQVSILLSGKGLSRSQTCAMNEKGRLLLSTDFRLLTGFFAEK